MVATKRKNTARTTQRKGAPDSTLAPEELRLWEAISARRKLLVQEIGLFADRSHPLCRALQTSGISAEAVGLVAEQSAIDVRRRLSAFDERICDLRSNGGKTYSLGKLAKLTEDFHNDLVKFAHSALRDWFQRQGDSLSARAFLSLLTRSQRPAILDVAELLQQANADPHAIDLEALDAEARAWCNMPTKSGNKAHFESARSRAHYIVARATGWDPNGEDAASSGGLTPDQVRRRTEK